MTVLYIAGTRKLRRGTYMGGNGTASSRAVIGFPTAGAAECQCQCHSPAYDLAIFTLQIFFFLRRRAPHNVYYLVSEQTHETITIFHLILALIHLLMNFFFF